MFEPAATQAEPSTPEALWASAREVWNMVSGHFAPSFEAFASTPTLRRDHAIMRPMVLGLEHFVRRCLLLLALAMQSLPVIRRPKRAAAPRPPSKRVPGLRIFEPVLRKPSAPGSARFRVPAAGPHPEGPLQARLDRERDEEYRQQNLARDPLERSRPMHVPSDLERPRAKAGAALPLRGDHVSGRGLAVRMIALARILEEPEAYAVRLRRTIDRLSARREEAPWIGPPAMAPWPRDAYARRIFMHDELARLWPGADEAIALMLAAAFALAPAPDSS